MNVIHNPKGWAEHFKWMCKHVDGGWVDVDKIRVGRELKWLQMREDKVGWV